MKNFLFHAPSYDLDELVFEGRNKAYGAYDLRLHAGDFMKKSLLISMLIFSLTIGVGYLLTQTTSAPSKIPMRKVVATFQPIEEPITPKTKKSIPPATAPEKKIKTYNNQLPTPVDVPKMELKQTTIPKDAKPGLSNKEGIVAPPQYLPPLPPPKATSETEGVSKGQPSNVPFTKVDEQAKFIGGLDAFRQEIANNFDTSIFYDLEGTVTTMVTFIVEKDGTLSHVKATGTSEIYNEEAVRTVKSIHKKWSPALIDGQPVRSYFQIPITMKISEF